MVRQVVTFFSFFFCILSIQAQESDFSQVINNHLYTNPAFAGSKLCPRLIIAARNSHISYGTAFMNFSASFDKYFESLQSGLGLLVLHSRKGKNFYTNTTYGAIYSKSIRLSRLKSIRTAMQVNYVQSIMTNRGLTYSEMFDPIEGPIFDKQEPDFSVTSHRFDAGVGGMWYSEKEYVGISLCQLVKPKWKYSSKTPLYYRKYSIHAGKIFSLGGGFSKNKYDLLTNVYFQKQYVSNQIIIGCQVKRNVLAFGTWIKQSLKFDYHSFVILFGFYKNNIKFAYNMDIIFKTKGTRLYDTHEISVAYLPGCNEKKKKFKAIKSPEL
ncbi:MAG: PorP/SprF family type IX secretion system membrane protein [Bacteroidales bacterium]